MDHDRHRRPHRPRPAAGVPRQRAVRRANFRSHPGAGSGRSRPAGRRRSPLPGPPRAPGPATPEERPRVKVQCLRLLATLRLDSQKTALISRFVDNYLRLQPQEVRVLDEELENISEMEKKAIVEITTSWKEEGRVEGLREGLVALLTVMFGEGAASLIGELQAYDLMALSQLKEKLLAPGARLEDLR